MSQKKLSHVCFIMWLSNDNPCLKTPALIFMYQVKIDSRVNCPFLALRPCFLPKEGLGSKRRRCIDSDQITGLTSLRPENTYTSRQSGTNTVEFLCLHVPYFQYNNRENS